MSHNNQLTADETLFIKEKKIKLDGPHDFRKDPEFQKWIKDLSNNILDGIFPREGVDNENNEALMYLYKHQTKKLKCDENCLKLFTPENIEKFEECRKQIKYEPNKEVTKEDNNKLYCNYYLNNLTNLEGIFKLIDKIYKKEAKPFKIGFDCGFIIEDTKEHTYLEELCQ